MRASAPLSNHQNMRVAIELHYKQRLRQNKKMFIYNTKEIPDDDVDIDDSEGITPLHQAIRKKNVENVKELLKHGVNVNGVKFGGTPLLHQALFSGDTEILRELLTHGADINVSDYKGTTPLHLALLLGNREAVDELLIQGANVNLTDNVGNTPLIFAVRSFEVAGCIKPLLRYGADINMANHKGITPLHQALSSWCNLYAIRELLNHGANVNVADCNNRTPLQQAVYMKVNVQIVKELLKRGARSDMVDKDGNTVLHLTLGHSESLAHILELLAHGADIDAVNHKGRTVFHQVVYRKDVKMLQELHKLGANINVADKHGNTPLDLALRYGHRRIIEELLKHWDYLNLDSGKCKKLLFKVAKDIPHCKLIIRSILIHVLQSDYTDLLNSKEISELDGELARYFESCISELLQMKTMKIVTGVSLFDFFATKNINTALYSNNERTKVITVESELITNYPIYHDLIFPLVKHALKRGVLITKLKEIGIYSRNGPDSGQNLGEKIHLDDGSMTLIAKYLSNHDLRCLAKAFHNSKSRISATTSKKRSRKRFRNTLTSKRVRKACKRIKKT